jgi:hypothetical protein
MGTNMPSSNHAALEWLEGHIAQWNTNQAGIGLTSAQTADIALTVANVRSDFTSVETVRAESLAKTSEFNSNAAAMRLKASKLISTIKSFAGTSGDAATVYTLAGLTPKGPSSPALPPEQPTGLKAILNGDGSVTIEWDGRGPTGTVYNINRKVAGETAFTFIGQSGARDKAFTDTGVPPGSASAVYTVQGVRGSDMGLLSQAMTVFFGTVDGAGVGEAAA